MISPRQLDCYNHDGFLIVQGFAEEHECDALRERAEQLVQEFEPAEVVSIFTPSAVSETADLQGESSSRPIDLVAKDRGKCPGRGPDWQER
jgi:hypothetical protein